MKEITCKRNEQELDQRLSRNRIAQSDDRLFARRQHFHIFMKTRVGYLVGNVVLKSKKL